MGAGNLRARCLRHSDNGGSDTSGSTDCDISVGDRDDGASGRAGCSGGVELSTAGIDDDGDHRHVRAGRWHGDSVDCVLTNNSDSGVGVRARAGHSVGRAACDSTSHGGGSGTDGSVSDHNTGQRGDSIPGRAIRDSRGTADDGLDGSAVKC